MKMNQDMDKIKVLLVEDEQTLAMIIKDTLEGQNFTSILLPMVRKVCVCSSTYALMYW